MNKIQNKNQNIRNYKKKTVTTFDIIKIKLESLFFVVLSIYILYKTHYLKVLLNDEDVNSFFKNLFLISMGCSSSFIIYVAYYLPYKGYEDCDDYNQNIIPIGAIIIFVAILSSIIAAWPIYRVWGIFINLIFIIGYVNVGNIIPKNGQIGSIFMILIFIGVCIYSYHF